MEMAEQRSKKMLEREGAMLRLIYRRLSSALMRQIGMELKHAFYACESNDKIILHRRAFAERDQYLRELSEKLKKMPKN